jgi:transglutaminase-like putative cysteine protease
VRALIKTLIPPNTPPFERASLLLAWVREHIEIKERAGLPRVEEVLTSREGDCNEQSALLTSLYRAAGLRAEQVFGLVALGDHAGYHAWVRVWLQGAWVEVDPARGLDYASAGHWAVSAGEASAQAELERLLFNAEVELESWR